MASSQWILVPLWQGGRRVLSGRGSGNMPPLFIPLVLFARGRNPVPWKRGTNCRNSGQRSQSAANSYCFTALLLFDGAKHRKMSLRKVGTAARSGNKDGQKGANELRNQSQLCSEKVA